MPDAALPPFGLTLAAPWWHFVLHGGKTIENRSSQLYSKARERIGKRVMITTSRSCSPKAIREAWASVSKLVPDRYKLPSNKYFKTNGGLWVATARIADVYAPWDATLRPWGQESKTQILLDDIRPQDPVPVHGGLNMWRPSRCPACDMIIANQCRHPCKGAQC